MATATHDGRSEFGATDVINNGRGRSDVFLRSARIQERIADRRPSARTLNVASSTSVRINAVDDSVYFFRVNALSYIGLAIVNIGLVVAGLVVLPRHWGDDAVCDATFREKWRWWALALTARKAFITPAHLVSAAALLRYKDSPALRRHLEVCFETSVLGRTCSFMFDFRTCPGYN